MHPIKHLKTITKHRHMVMRFCFRVGLIRQGLCHDLSKYSPTEFWQGAKYYQGTRSPNARAREAEGYSTAWMHHKGRNKHHYEYWTDVPPGEHHYEPVPMPTRYLVESVMDRIAASKVYLGDKYTDGAALAYLAREHAVEQLHPDTYAKMHFLFTLLEANGETVCFRFLREVVLPELPFDQWEQRRDEMLKT
ncbi:MAG: catalase [Oscillospiraceae bacterium]|nr:catalase [Oscillospiraceae bacterium]